ncbi:hypothetical protein ADJ70_07020 [Olsenella sp. oral taxon 807]|nr:hypothetical protein ADJ70_07020 [Olsenella sp. oral taxon 807]
MASIHSTAGQGSRYDPRYPARRGPPPCAPPCMTSSQGDRRGFPSEARRQRHVRAADAGIRS